MTLSATVAIAAGCFGLVVAFLIYGYVKRQHPGSAAMQDLATLKRVLESPSAP